MFIIERLEDAAKKAEKKLYCSKYHFTEITTVDILYPFFKNHAITFLPISISIPTMGLHRLKKNLAVIL